jgi:hypothetical protein
MVCSVVDRCPDAGRNEPRFWLSARVSLVSLKAVTKVRDFTDFVIKMKWN